MSYNGGGYGQYGRSDRGRDDRGRRDDRGGNSYGRRDDRDRGGGYYGDRRGGNDRNNQGYGGAYDRSRDRSRGRGYGGRPDRSRSRDDRGRGGWEGRGGGGREWGGRGGGRGRGGRGGGRGQHSGPRPEKLLVKTNYYKLEIQPTNQGPVEWHQYHVEIKSAIRDKIFNEDKSFKGFKVVPNTKKDGPIDIDKGSELSRRIMRTLASDKGLSYASDGSSNAFAPSRLFEEPFKVYEVKVKRDCDEDEEDADLVQNAYFLVKLTFTNLIVPTKVDQLTIARQAMDVILKSAMVTVGMKAFGRNPRAFYFPEDLQPEVINSRLLQNMLRNEPNFMPMIGLFQAAKFCEDGNAYVNTDTVVDFANREFKQLMGTKVPVKILDEQRSTICGIRVDLHNYIRDDRTKRDILEKLEHIKINVKYTVPMRPDYQKRMRDKGKSDAEIERSNIKVRRNKRVREDQNKKMKIVWGADDENLYSFLERKREDDGVPPKKYTVYSYNKERYGITLRYPKMPIVFLGNKEWFPIEFLFQSFGKMRAANSPEQVKAVLDYYNQHAGTGYVGNVSRMAQTACDRLQRMGLSIDQVLRQYNLRKSSEPIELEARVLTQPTLKFADYDANVNDGDWKIGRDRFKKPAQMFSFAVVNLAGAQNSCAFEFMEKFLKKSKSHGMQTPDVDPRLVLNNIISHAHGTNPEAIENAFRNAIDMANDFFVFDKWRNYSDKDKGVWFKTRVKREGLRKTAVNEEEPLYDCLVLPPSDDPSRKVIGLILPSNIGFASHRIVLPDGREENGRLMIKVREKGTLIDPFDYRYDFNKGYHVTQDQHGSWNERVTFERRLFQLDESGDNMITEDQAKSTFPVYMLNGKRIKQHLELPSIVFVILPEKVSDYYGVTKKLSQFESGLQTQCIIAKNFVFKRDGAKDQYCSNVALKVNAKLSSISNKAHVWSTHHGTMEGIPWVRDVPTFVMGISISNTLGQDSVSIISASVCLDSSCMRFAQDVKIQSKTEVIDESILEDITKSLLIQYYLHNNNTMPQRMLVYRDGVSDGSFSRVQSLEIQCLRRAFLKFKEEMSGTPNPDCEMCKNKGCLFCCPLITYVVCMTRNNIKMVPSDGVGSENVWSGTCLDEVIMDVQNLTVTPSKIKSSSANHIIYTEPQGKGYDFILVAHGGRMGTSKTVHYRCILNENAVWRPSSPTATPLLKSELELLTFQMSFQYSTASKAVRVVPVVHYSSRLANIAMGYYAYLRGRKGSGKEELVFKKLDDSDEMEISSIGNSKTEARGQFIRADVEEIDTIPDHLKTSLLPKFAAFVETSLDENDKNLYDSKNYQTPFYTHISA